MTEQQPQRSQQLAPLQPEYGQVRQPEYGALASQYPATYNPYLYGEPSAKPSEHKDAQHAHDAKVYGASAHSTPAHSAACQTQSGDGAPNPFEPSSNPSTPSTLGANTQSGSEQASRHSRGNGVSLQPIRIDNPDDPRQNPFYNRWDGGAIIAFVLALFSIPLLPLVMGVSAMRRTKALHMRGRGLAIAAVVINALTMTLSVWMMLNGINAQDLAQWLSTHMDWSFLDGDELDGASSIRA